MEGDKEPGIYLKERDSFLANLKQFHKNRRTPFHQLPCVGGKEVDLYLLYSQVTASGGWQKVNKEQRWEEIQILCHVPWACTNAGQAIKQIYIRYLELYEKVHHFGEDPDQRDYEELSTDGISGKRRVKPFDYVSARYNDRQHDVSDFIRETCGMCTNFVPPNEYSKLEKSLLSGLPNEVDFAINVCTLLSNEGHHTIQLKTCPRLLDLLLGHIGIFSEGESSLFPLYNEGWKPYHQRNFLRFWHESVEDKEIRELMMPDGLQAGDESRKNTSDSVLSEMEASELLNLGRDLGLQDAEGQRVLQMAMILRNLSFEEENMGILASSVLVYRFLLLCIHNKWHTLKQLGYDTLGNIAVRMLLDPIDCRSTQLMIRTVSRSVASPDRYQVVSGLGILSQLCQVDENEDILAECLEPRVYEDIVTLLTVHDIHLIVCTLEALYQLSELGEVTSNHIAGVRRAVDNLVNLVSVEAQSYGPSSLIGIKVVEHIPARATEPVPSQTPSVTPAAASKAVSRPPVVSTPPGQIMNLPPAVSTPPSCTRPLAVATPPLGARQHVVATPPPQSIRGTPMTNANLQHRPVVSGMAQKTGLVGDVESSACNWLQANYEYSPEGSACRMQMYAGYLSACSQQSTNSYASSSSFANCIRVTFSKVEGTKLERDDGTLEVEYKGIRKRAIPLPFSLTADLRAGGTVSRSKTANRVCTPTKAAAHSPPPHRMPWLSGGVGQPASPQSQGSPMRPLSIAQSPPGMQTPQSPPLSPSQYPTIQQALLRSAAAGVAMSPPPRPATPQKTTLSCVSPSVSPSPSQQASPGPTCFSMAQNKAPDSNLIKTLLASKVTQHMHKLQQQGDPTVPMPAQSTNLVQLQQQPTTYATLQVEQSQPPCPSQGGAAGPPMQSVPYGGQQQWSVNAYPHSVQSGQYTCYDTQGQLQLAGQQHVMQPSSLPPPQAGLSSSAVGKSPAKRKAGSPSSSRSASPKSKSPTRSKSPKASKPKKTQSPSAKTASSTNSLPQQNQPQGLEVCSTAQRALDVVQRDQLLHEAKIQKVTNQRGYQVSEAKLERLPEDVRGIQEAKIEKVENRFVVMLEDELEKQAQAENSVRVQVVSDGEQRTVGGIADGSDIGVEQLQQETANNRLEQHQPDLLQAAVEQCGLIDNLYESENLYYNNNPVDGSMSTKPVLFDPQLNYESENSNTGVILFQPESKVESLTGVSIFSVCSQDSDNKDTCSTRTEPDKCDNSHVCNNDGAQSNIMVNGLSPCNMGDEGSRQLVVDNSTCTSDDLKSEKNQHISQLVQESMSLRFNGVVNHIGNGECNLGLNRGVLPSPNDQFQGSGLKLDAATKDCVLEAGKELLKKKPSTEARRVETAENGNCGNIESDNLRNGHALSVGNDSMKTAVETTEPPGTSTTTVAEDLPAQEEEEERCLMIGQVDGTEHEVGEGAQSENTNSQTQNAESQQVNPPETATDNSYFDVTISGDASSIQGPCTAASGLVRFVASTNSFSSEQVSVGPLIGQSAASNITQTFSVLPSIQCSPSSVATAALNAPSIPLPSAKLPTHSVHDVSVMNPKHVLSTPHTAPHLSSIGQMPIQQHQPDNSETLYKANNQRQEGPVASAAPGMQTVATDSTTSGDVHLPQQQFSHVQPSTNAAQIFLNQPLKLTPQNSQQSATSAVQLRNPVPGASGSSSKVQYIINLQGQPPVLQPLAQQQATSQVLQQPSLISSSNSVAPPQQQVLAPQVSVTHQPESSLQQSSQLQLSAMSDKPGIQPSSQHHQQLLLPKQPIQLVSAAQGYQTQTASHQLQTGPQPAVLSQNQQPLQQVATSQQQQQQLSQQQVQQIRLSQQQMMALQSQQKLVLVQPQQAQPNTTQTQQHVVLAPQQAVSSQQQVVMASQQAVTSQQQMVLTPQQAVTSQQQMVLTPQQAVTSQQQMVLAPQQAVTSQQQMVIASQQAGSSQQQRVLTPQQAVTSQQQMVVAGQQAMTSQQQMVIAPQQAMTSQQQMVIAPQQAMTSQQQQVVLTAATQQSLASHSQQQVVFAQQQPVTSQSQQQVVFAQQPAVVTQQQVVFTSKQPVMSHSQQQVVITPQQPLASQPQQVILPSSQTMTSHPQQQVILGAQQQTQQLVLTPRQQRSLQQLVQPNQQLVFTQQQPSQLSQPQQQLCFQQQALKPQKPQGVGFTQAQLCPKPPSRILPQPTAAPQVIQQQQRQIACTQVATDQQLPRQQMASQLSHKQQQGAPSQVGQSQITKTLVGSQPSITNAKSAAVRPVSHCTNVSTSQPRQMPPSPLPTPPPPMSPQNFPNPMRSPCASPTTTGSGSSSKRPSSHAKSDKPSKKRKKDRSGSMDSQRSSTSRPSPVHSPAQPPATPAAPIYLCDWHGCKRCFENSKGLNSHVYSEHFNSAGPSFQCLWQGCDSLRRQRWSFVTHLQDRHLNEHALKVAAANRQKIANGGVVPPAPPPPAPVSPSVYPQDAALQAIRRFSARPPYPEFMEGKQEGPVTKHIRLTSSLILRNLSRYSALGRSLIKRHETMLSYVSLSCVESSSAIANCLWELHRH